MVERDLEDVGKPRRDFKVEPLFLSALNVRHRHGVYPRACCER
jgi:hypothetical protein